MRKKGNRRSHSFRTAKALRFKTLGEIAPLKSGGGGHTGKKGKMREDDLLIILPGEDVKKSHPKGSGDGN